MKCDYCLNSRPIISENGTHYICCLTSQQLKKCLTGEKDYFEERGTYKMTLSLKGRKSLLYLWKKQNKICPLCGERITADIQWNVREKVVDGKSNKYLVHDKCYKQHR